MAIAFDAASGQQDNSTTSQTFSHTCTGSNLLLLVGFITNNTTDIITGVTYNSVSMTQLNTQTSTTNSYISYVYGLLNPDTGANNVNITASSASLLWTTSASYTGVKQSGLPDATSSGNSPTNTGTWSSSVTTVADNCWHYTHVRGGSPLAASGGTVERRDQSQSACYDSNGAITPAGSDSNTGTTSNPNNDGAMISVSFAPATGAAIATPTSMALMGVGM